MSQSQKRSIKAAKEARGGGAFLPVRMDVLRSEALAQLSPFACKLLFDIASQWRLGNNGDSSTAFEKVMRPRGWRSKATLQKAIEELLASGLIIKTRQGGLHQCSLYGLGWLAIDECAGKLEMRATKRPINHWLEPIAQKNDSASTLRVPRSSKRSNLSTPRVLDG